jgi:hypothetical protein
MQPQAFAIDVDARFIHMHLCGLSKLIDGDSIELLR